MPEVRTFAVHAAHEDRARRLHIESPTPEAAAMEYLACCVHETDEVEVVVMDAETGCEHCFRLDVGGATLNACG